MGMHGFHFCWTPNFLITCNSDISWTSRNLYLRRRLSYFVDANQSDGDLLAPGTMKGKNHKVETSYTSVLLISCYVGKPRRGFATPVHFRTSSSQYHGFQKVTA